jgi:putative flippase GtrA
VTRTTCCYVQLRVAPFSYVDVTLPDEQRLASTVMQPSGLSTNRIGFSQRGLRAPSRRRTGTTSFIGRGSTLLRKALDARTVRYLLAGGTLAVLGVTLLTAIVAVTSVPAGLASLGAALTITPLTYLTHRHYTFRSDNQVSYEMGAFLSVVALNYPLGAALVFVLVDLLHLPVFSGGLLATALLPVINYVLHTKWVFRNRGSS